MPLSSRNKKTDELPNISNAEWEVVQPLWDRGPLAARDIYAALSPGHGWAYKTVKTMLARLVAKGIIEYEQIGNSYLYRAAYTRDQVTRREVVRFIDRVLGGSLLPMVSHFIEHHDLSDEEQKKLQQLLDKNKLSGAKTRKEKKP